MIDGWREVRLRQIATVYDGPHATPTKLTEGPWYLSISSLQDGRVDLAESAHLSEDDFQQWTRRVAPRPGDTLFSYETRLGAAGYWDREEPAVLGRRMGLLRPKADQVDPRFLTYAYLGPQFQETIRKRKVSGATVERILLADLPNWPVLIPSLEMQRRIVDVLGAIDDLIDGDVSLISSIREIGGALFETWIDPDAPSLCLSDVAKVNSEIVDERTGSLTYLDISSVRDGYLEWPQPILWQEAPSRARRVLREGDTVWSTVRPNRRSHALVISPPENAVGSTGFAVLRARAGLSPMGPATLFAATDRPAFTEYLAANASGSAYPAAGFDVFARAPLPSLGEKSQRFEDLMWPMLELAGHLAKEIAELRSTRDELLPLLMSGRVTPGEVA